MKLKLLLSSLLVLMLSSYLHGQNLDQITVLEESLGKIDVELSSIYPWENGGLTTSQSSLLNATQKVASEAAKDKRFLATAYSLLDKYKEDKYPRQILFQSIIDREIYSNEDLKFLTLIFVRTLNLKYEKLPRGFELIWIGPTKIRVEIAHKIINVTKEVSAMNDPDENLLYIDPNTWIKKYGRN